MKIKETGKVTPDNSRIIVQLNRNTDIGYCKSVDEYDLSKLSEKMLRKKISSLFHSLKKDMYYHEATFLLKKKRLFSIYQNKEDFSNQCFAVIFYRSGKATEEKRCTYNETRNLILDAYGFHVSEEESPGEDDIEVDDLEDEETEEIEANYLFDVAGFNELE